MLKEIFIVSKHLFPFFQICPVCATKVRINMASHVITQHESILKISFELCTLGVNFLILFEFPMLVVKLFMKT